MGNFLEEFKKKIKERKIKIAIVGLGYVGLPLAVEFARKGLSIIGLDIDRDRLNRIKKKESYITDVSCKTLRQVTLSGKFRLSGNFTILRDADVIIICVPTPLKRKYYPDISYIKQAVRSISKNMKRPSLVVLESTTYPGTTEGVILPLLEQQNLKHNRDFYLSFSPERIDPGNRSHPLHKIPKVVGGVSPEATDLTVLVYKNIIDKIVVVSSARVAEAVKLLENTFRLVNIGLINELAMMGHKMDIDIWEVIEAAKTKPFGFLPFYPGPGVGGHCIPKDPLYLYWKAKHHGFNLRFIKLASEIVSYMPEYIVQRLEHILKDKNKKLGQVRILIIGVTYKKDVKDLRKSPALDIIEILQKNNASVSYYDPLIPYLRLNQVNLKSIDLDRDSFSGFDCVVIATDHSGLDYRFILKNSQLIFDTRNVYKSIQNKKIVRL